MAITSDHVRLTRKLVEAIRLAKSEITALRDASTKQETRWNRLMDMVTPPLIDYVLRATKAHEESVAFLHAYEVDSQLADAYVKEYAVMTINLNERELDTLIREFHYKREAEAITDVLPLRNTTL